MKFLLIKNLKTNNSFKPLLGFLLLFMLFYLTGDPIVKAQNLGLTYTTLSSTLFGDAVEFLDPMSVDVFLENWHTEIFFMMMVLLTLCTIYIRLDNASKLSMITTNITLSSALLALVSLALGYFYFQTLLYIYLGSFYLWHLGAFYMTLISLKRLYAD